MLKGREELVLLGTVGAHWWLVQAMNRQYEPSQRDGSTKSTQGIRKTINIIYLINRYYEENSILTITDTGKALDNMTLTYDKKKALSKLGIKVNFLNLIVYLLEIDLAPN